MLRYEEVPVASSMITLAQQTTPLPIQEFMLYWIAFNSIYTTIATGEMAGSRLVRGNDGSVETIQNGSVRISKTTRGPSERDMLDNVFKHFSSPLKKRLIGHDSTSYFACRIPQWRHRPIKRDARGQRMNGVINLTRTIDERHPVWSPIDIPAYKRYTQGNPRENDEDLLAKQILDLLYTIRNNTFHGGKVVENENDNEVLRKGLSLLKMIVHELLPNW